VAFSRNRDRFTSFTASSNMKLMPDSWVRMENISLIFASLNLRVIGLFDLRFSS
jgi:hypothetical protein